MANPTQPNLPMLLKRLAMTQMAIAEHIANPWLKDSTKAPKLLEEARAIVADLQAFTNSHIISVVARNKVGQ